MRIHKQGASAQQPCKWQVSIVIFRFLIPTGGSEDNWEPEGKKTDRHHFGGVSQAAIGNFSWDVLDTSFFDN